MSTGTVSTLNSLAERTKRYEVYRSEVTRIEECIRRSEDRKTVSAEEALIDVISDHDSCVSSRGLAFDQGI